MASSAASTSVHAAVSRTDAQRSARPGSWSHTATTRTPGRDRTTRARFLMWICAAPSRTTSQVDMPSALLIYRLGPQHSRNDSKSFHSALPAQVPVQELSDPVINPIEDLLKPPPLRVMPRVVV